MDAAVLPGSKQAVCSVFPLLGCSWASRFVQDWSETLDWISGGGISFHSSWHSSPVAEN